VLPWLRNLIAAATKECRPVKFARLGAPGSEQPAVQPDGPDAGGKWFSLTGLTADINGAFLESGGIGQARDSLAAGTLPEITDAAQLRMGSPVARPGAVVGIGLNYAGHAAESGAPVRGLRRLRLPQPSYDFVELLGRNVDETKCRVQ
jgi:hypothetical protein